MSTNRFFKINHRPRWEGIIFTGIDFSDKRISLADAQPHEKLKHLIESIWFMEWNIPESEGLQCIGIPNPCSKFILIQREDKTFRPFFVGTKENASLFTYTGRGVAMGFDFRPGGLFPLLHKPMSDWPETGILAQDLFPDFPSAPTGLWNEEVLSAWLNDFDDYLINKLGAPADDNYERILPLIESVLSDKIQSPEEMAQSCGMSLRTLQRVFQKEVGLSPRDVLRIARFNSAIRQISQDDFTEFADVALASGFFDQPHMVNEFQKLVQAPPSKFKRYI